jgi:uncharacterized membrane protein required for colicin V production
MVISIILDLILVALLLMAVIDGRKRGLIKMVWRVGSWVITVALAMVISGPFTTFVMKTDYAAQTRERIAEEIESRVSVNGLVPESLSVGDIAEMAGISSVIIPESTANVNLLSGVNSSVNAAVANAADTIAYDVMRMALKLITSIIMLVVIKTVMRIIYRVLNTVSKLPVISQANHMLGALLGLANMLFVVYLVLAVVSFAAKPGTEWYNMIDNTYLVNYFYNNNILLHLIKL